MAAILNNFLEVIILSVYIFSKFRLFYVSGEDIVEKDAILSLLRLFEHIRWHITLSTDIGFDYLSILSQDFHIAYGRQGYNVKNMKCKYREVYIFGMEKGQGSHQTHSCIFSHDFFTTYVKASTFTKYVHRKNNYRQVMFHNGRQKWVSFFFGPPCMCIEKYAHKIHDASCSEQVLYNNQRLP